MNVQARTARRPKSPIVNHFPALVALYPLEDRRIRIGSMPIFYSLGLSRWSSRKVLVDCSYFRKGAALSFRPTVASGRSLDLIELMFGTTNARIAGGVGYVIKGESRTFRSGRA